MISVEEATQIIQSFSFRPAVEKVDLHRSVGRVLAEPLIADRDFPPFDRVTMDGIAIHTEFFDRGQRQFKIQEVCPAGSPKVRLKDRSQCIEIMTGAILPDNTNAVIRYEDLLIEGEMVTVLTNQIKNFQNIHEKGSDHPIGKELVSTGMKISAAELAIAATIGKSRIKVYKRPSIALISSGDELVDVHQVPEEHQIRKSNILQMAGSLAQKGYHSKQYHIMDDFNMIIKELEVILEKTDVIILSGGVSMGKKDYIPKALNQLGITKHFHKVRQRPGKPFWFGTGSKNKFVFALPGNPVSSFMCLHRYVLPWLEMNENQADKGVFVMLEEDVHFKPDLNYFVPVKLNYQQDGSMTGKPMLGNGSGDLANLSFGDGFLELPRGKDIFRQGEIYRYLSYR